jgi:hypothetical protein
MPGTEAATVNLRRHTSVSNEALVIKFDPPVSHLSIWSSPNHNEKWFAVS